MRSFVERGSIAYSAVTQPAPLPESHLGTPGVKDAVHKSLVRPKEMSALPSACSLHPRSIVTGRNSLAARPSIRVVVIGLAPRGWRYRGWQYRGWQYRGWQY